MPSLTGLTEDVLLTQALQFVVSLLETCDYTVCSVQRTHAEPNKIECCDCEGGGSIGYTVHAWIVDGYDADGDLSQASAFACPTFDATTIGFTVARCWPDEKTVPKSGGARDAAAAELANVLSCLRDAFAACENNPRMFHVEPTEDEPDPPLMLCTRLTKGRFTADKDEFVTRYGEDGTVSYVCAGWRWSVTIA